MGPWLTLNCQTWKMMSFLFLDVSLKLIYSSFAVKANCLGLQGLDWVLLTFQNVPRQRREAFSREEVKLRDLKFPVNPHSQVAISAFWDFWFWNMNCMIPKFCKQQRRWVAVSFSLPWFSSFIGTVTDFCKVTDVCLCLLVFNELFCFGSTSSIYI